MHLSKLLSTLHCGAFILFGLNITNAQNFGVMNAPVPPSPTASSILKSIDVPVNHYTGIPDITIPLFELKGKDLSLPINLVFNSNGLKVDEIPGWVGMGWNLSCSGVVARTIMDGPDNIGFGYTDDYMDQYYYNNGIAEPIQNRCDGVTTLGSTEYAFYNLLNGTAPNSPNYLDTEPDIYSFSLPSGPGGKFVIGRDGVVRVLPKSPLKISYSVLGGLDNLSFNISTQDGSLYTFGSYDRIQSVISSSNYLMNGQGRWAQIYPKNAWYLDAIHSANASESINFSYADETLTYKSPITESKGFLVRPSFPGDEAGINYDNTDFTSFSNNVVTGKRLSAIALGYFEVYFKASTTQRFDQLGGHRLEEIIVLHQGDTLKRFKLYHSYFSEQSQEGYLRLDSLVEIGKNGKRMPAYKFSYNEAASQPVRSSLSKDHWGYFNGAYNLTSLPTYFVPEVSYAPGLNYSINFAGANREPNVDYAKYGTMQKITYPTGGHATFGYEGNTYSRFGLEFEKIEKLGAVFINGGQTGNTIDPLSGRFIHDFNFTLSDTTYVFVDAVETCVDQSGQGGLFADCGIIILGVDQAYSQQLIFKTFFKIPPGTFRLHAELGTNRVNDVIGASIRWYDKGDTLYTKNGPGVRIKSVTHFDPVLEKSLIKRYTYNFENGVSSGLLHDIVRYDYDYRAMNNSMQQNQPSLGNGITIPNCINSTYHVVRVIENKSLNNFTNAGTLLGYDRVTEQSVTEGDINGVIGSTFNTPSPEGNGWSVYNFFNEFTTHDERATSPGVASPNTLINAYAEFSGKLKSKEVYNGAGQLIMLEENAYQKSIANSIYGFQAEPFARENCNICNFVFGVYRHDSFAMELLSSTTTNYAYTQNGIDSIKVSSVNQLDWRTNLEGRDAFFLLRSTTTSNSKGTLNTSYFYPFDFSNQPNQALLNSLIYENKLSPLVQITSNQETGKALTGAILNLEKQQAFSGWRLTKYYTLESATPIDLLSAQTIPDLFNPPTHFKQKESYIYDANGNLHAIKRTGNDAAVFLWSLDTDRQLIAEVKGAKEYEVYFNGYEEFGTLDVNSRTGARSKPSNFTFIPPASLVITPTTKLSYWYWENSMWNFWETNYSGGDVLINQGSKIDDLRIYPAGAMMTTYTYKPGVGVSSITDVNNKTQFYIYDEFNRLQYVKDHEGNILQYNKYHYIGQQD